MDRVLSVWNAVNGARDKKNLTRLELDMDLSLKADEILNLRLRGRPLDTAFAAPAVWSLYMTNPRNPSLVPDSALLLIVDPAFGRIGISALTVETRDLRHGLEVSLAVVLVLDRSPAPARSLPSSDRPVSGAQALPRGRG